MPLTSFQFWMAAGGCGPRAHQFVRSQLWPFPFRSLVILQASATHSGALAQEALTIFFFIECEIFSLGACYFLPFLFFLRSGRIVS